MTTVAAMSAVCAALAVAAIGLGLRWQVPVGRGRRHLRPRRSRRDHPLSAEQWAAFLDGVAAEVRTGASLTVALQHAPPGASPDTSDHDRGRDHDAVLVQHTLGAARQVGGPVASTLDAAAAVLRERVAIRADAQVHSAQARLSARVLTAVPVGFCGWCVLTSSSFRRACAAPPGRICAVLGTLCNLAGWAWMRRIVANAER